MDYQLEELEGLRRKLKIKVPQNIVLQKIEFAYRELNKQISMPGFRPGKIPRSILEKQVPLQAMTQMWQDLMQEYYNQALTESGIVPAGPPEIDHSDIEEIDREKPFTFSVTLDIKPQLQFKNYKGLKFPKTEFKVTDEEVDFAIRQHLEPFGSMEILPPDHAVGVGDFVIMDFEGSMHGEVLEGSKASGYEVRVGQKKMIAGFEDQLVGHKQGEPFEVKVQLPMDWNKKMRRVSMPIPGKDGEELPDTATFQVQIKQVKKLNLPELTDEFVQAQGEESVASFRRKVKTDLQAQKEHLEEMHIKQDIFDYLVKQHDVDPPGSLVDQEIRFMIDGMKFQIQQSGMSLENSGFEEEKAKEEWRERAVYNSKGYMILDGIARQEKLNVTQSDLEGEYERLSQQTGKPVEDVRKTLMANQEHLNQTTSRILGQKALNLIYSQCEFEFLSEEEARTRAQSRKQEQE
ncbi:trigger factor [Nitrospina watsonii]|uniref:Trigger factor n=1 Tax=Nitrospina watsonii TaxID=1323948 RepID=A0ABN8W349_9BACT|nr:trigger factor [Nitrospina watsonii]CAI2718483.1 Trigger factor [Nitrospina watsonii]